MIKTGWLIEKEFEQVESVEDGCRLSNKVKVQDRSQLAWMGFIGHEGNAVCNGEDLMDLNSKKQNTLK